MDLIEETTNGGKASEIYNHLSPNRNEIRLLTLISGAEEENIQCSLATVDLDNPDRPSYDAFSYVWGDATHSIQILVNGRPLLITQNLHTALKHLRNPHEDLRFWIDAISVNQADLKERGEQVRLMQTVYSKAASTVIWLGPEGDDSARAIDFMDLMALVYQDWVSKRELGEHSNLDESFWGSQDSWKLKQDTKALVQFMKRPWFSRVWVIQEAAMTLSLKILCGNRWTTWSNLANVYNFFATMPVDFSETFNSWESLERIADIHLTRLAHFKALYANAAGINMLTLLAKHRSSRATDPRDKCVALMGLSSTAYSQDSANFYSQSVSQVYTSTMAAISHQTPQTPLAFLSYCGYPRRRDDLPSWVPDWSYCDFAGHPIHWWEIDTGVRPGEIDFGARSKGMPYNPILGLSIKTFRIFNFQNDNTTLVASGVLFDTLANHTCTILKGAGGSFGNLPPSTALGQTARKIPSTSLKLPGYPTGESLEEVIWRTMVMNRDRYGFPAPTVLFKRAIYCFLGRAKGYRKKHHHLDAIPENRLNIWSDILWELFHALEIGVTTFAEIVQKPISEVENQAAPSEEDMQKVVTAIASATGGRKLAVSEKGYLGLVPACTEIGDVIVILFGCPVPVVLRERGGWYECIGTCYVHGIMEGEIVPGIENGEYEIREFEMR